MVKQRIPQSVNDSREMEFVERVEKDNLQSLSLDELAYRFEEIEQRVRKLIENAIARFNFIKSDEHERIEKRIEALEEKLNQLVKETVVQKTESSERI